MTTVEARLKISMHAGKTENFFDGYRYALRYGIQNLEDIQQKYDEIFMCLKVLYETSCFVNIDKELLSELNEILWGSILYVNSQASNYRVVGVFAEVLSETLFYLLENIENPFDAFDNYKENYDDILCEEIKN